MRSGGVQFQDLLNSAFVVGFWQVADLLLGHVMTLEYILTITQLTTRHIRHKVPWINVASYRALLFFDHADPITRTLGMLILRSSKHFNLRAFKNSST